MGPAALLGLDGFRCGGYPAHLPAPTDVTVYELTDVGRALQPALKKLPDWARVLVTLAVPRWRSGSPAAVRQPWWRGSRARGSPVGIW